MDLSIDDPVTFWHAVRSVPKRIHLDITRDIQKPVTLHPTHRHMVETQIPILHP